MSGSSEITGGMTERVVRVFMLVDTSTSMRGNKIGTLNTAMRDVVPVMRDAEADSSRGTIEVQVLEFSSGSRWQNDQPINIQQFQWTDLVANGTTDMGSAFTKLGDALAESVMPRNAFPPVIILVTDGQPTDNYRAGLDKVNAQRWSKPAIRCAISVGPGTNEAMLREFLGNEEWPLLPAKNVEDLKQYIQWATVALSQMSSTPLSSQNPPDPGGGGGDVTNAMPTPPEPSTQPPSDVW